MPIRAIVFDAYGTLYDVQSVLAATRDVCGDKGEVVTQVWRLKQLEYSWLRSVMGQYEDFWSVTRASLEYAMRCVGIEPSEDQCAPLMRKYLELDLYPEARAALDSLRGNKLAILSNGSERMLSALVEASGIGKLLHAVISVDGARAYKPSPACYELVDRALGVPKEDVLFVSSNGFDVAGAKRFGFKVVWVQRVLSVGASAQPAPGPREMFSLLRGRREELGVQPDYRVGALSELAALVEGIGQGKL